MLGLLGEVRVGRLLGMLGAECREGPESIAASRNRGDLAGLNAQARTLSRSATDIGAAALGDAALALAALSDLALAAPLIDALGTAAHATLSVVQQRMRRLPAVSAGA